jgi:hypothetical protein
MIMHPAVIALSLGSLVVTLMVLYAAFYGVKILKRWNLQSGSERQLMLERHTYLISTVMSYAFSFQLFSLFLFIFTADKLSSLFVGAMCAAGTLNANAFGYPTLLFKVANFILGGIWLILNYTDNRAIDYPLIKKKYLFLLVITPLITAEMVLQGAYFLNLDAHVITSCCGSLFSPEGIGAGAIFPALPVMPMRIAFFSAVFLTCGSGLLFYRKATPLAGYVFAFMSGLTFVVSTAALISFISLYFYELPTHHCPFCILQAEYLYVGYPLYITLLGGAVAGISTGALMTARNIPSLSELLPLVLKRLTLAAVVFYLLFTLISTWTMIFTDFKLVGY